MRPPSAEDRDTGNYTIAIVIWTAVVVFAGGFLFYNLIDMTDPQSGLAGPSGWMFILGLLAGALVTLPVWAIYGLVKQHLRNTLKLREDLAKQAGAPPAA